MGQHFKPTRSYWSDVGELRSVLEDRGKPINSQQLKFWLGVGFPLTRGSMVMWADDNAEYVLTTGRLLFSVGRLSLTAIDTITAERSHDGQREVGHIARSYLTLSMVGNDLEMCDIGISENTVEGLTDARQNLNASLQAQRKMGLTEPALEDYQRVFQTLILGERQTQS